MGILTLYILSGLVISLLGTLMLLFITDPCKLGLHRWDYPGGHCTDCGMCDEFFEKHSCRNKEGK